MTLRWARGQEGRFDAPLSSSGLHLPLTRKGLPSAYCCSARRSHAPWGGSWKAPLRGCTAYRRQCLPAPERPRSLHSCRLLLPAAFQTLPHPCRRQNPRPLVPHHCLPAFLHWQPYRRQSRHVDLRKLVITPVSSIKGSRIGTMDEYASQIFADSSLLVIHVRNFQLASTLAPLQIATFSPPSTEA